MKKMFKKTIVSKFEDMDKSLFSYGGCSICKCMVEKSNHTYPANFDVKKIKAKDIVNLKLTWYEKILKLFIGKTDSVAVSDVYKKWCSKVLKFVKGNKL